MKNGQNFLDILHIPVFAFIVHQYLETSLLFFQHEKEIKIKHSHAGTR